MEHANSFPKNAYIIACILTYLFFDFKIFLIEGTDVVIQQPDTWPVRWGRATEHCPSPMHSTKLQRHTETANSNSQDNVYGIQSSRHSHCMSSRVHLMNTAQALAGNQPLEQDDWLEPQICQNWQLQYYTHQRHTSLLSLKADTHFTILQKVEGLVNLGGWLHTKMLHLRRQSPIHVLTGPNVK